jgi:RNAse (barnase) inhibitor barstar
MMEQIVTIEGNNVSNFKDFVQEFNRVFCSQFNSVWHGNLDAFNDFLSWPEKKYTLVWKDSDLSRQRLGYDKMANWLEECIQNCHPSNVPELQLRLEGARCNVGQRMFDWLVEIIRDNQEFVELRLE